MRRSVLVAGVSAVLVLGPVGAASAAPAAPLGPPYASCADAWHDGLANLAVGEPGYALALDPDRNGIACERHDFTGGDPDTAVTGDGAALTLLPGSPSTGPSVPAGSVRAKVGSRPRNAPRKCGQAHAWRRSAIRE